MKVLVPLALSSLLLGCAGGALYPQRPPATPGLPVADPAPARVVLHATITAEALRQALDGAIPALGDGTFRVMGATERYVWHRSPLELGFDGGRIGARARVVGGVRVLGRNVEMPIDLAVRAEPVITADYQARLQSVEVQVTSPDARLKMAQGLAGALDTLRDQIAGKLRDVHYDLRPMVAEAHRRIVRPIDLGAGGALGEAHGCAELRVTSVEAGPTVLAGGVEKDLAVVVAPSVTLPCAADAAHPSALPPLANVPSVPSGPFTVTVPIAARYEELAHAMKLAFTDGKLYFSREFPQLYMSDPEVYASSDQLVLKLHIAGPIAKAGIRTVLDGDIFLAGHPQVVDNELRVPDLQPTIETSSFLLKLKAALDGNTIRDQAREALRLDLGARFAALRAKLSTELGFGGAATGVDGCLRAQVDRLEVTGVYPHGSYLRLYVSVTGQASVYLPCPATNG